MLPVTAPIRRHRPCGLPPCTPAADASDAARFGVACHPIRGRHDAAARHPGAPTSRRREQRGRRPNAHHPACGSSRRHRHTSRPGALRCSPRSSESTGGVAATRRVTGNAANGRCEGHGDRAASGHGTASAPSRPCTKPQPVQRRRYGLPSEPPTMRRSPTPTSRAPSDERARRYAGAIAARGPTIFMKLVARCRTSA